MTQPTQPITTRLEPDVIATLDRIVAAGLIPNRATAIAVAVEDWIRYTEWEALSAEWQAEHGAFTDEELNATAAAEMYGIRFVDGLPVPKASSSRARKSA